MRQELAAALLDRRGCFGVRGFHLPLAGSSVTRPNAPLERLAVDLHRAGEAALDARRRHLRLGVLGLGAADDLRAAAARAVSTFIGRRRHARRRALAELRRERRERVGADEQLGGREQLLGEVLVAAGERAPRLVEQIGGLAQRPRPSRRPA